MVSHGKVHDLEGVGEGRIYKEKNQIIIFFQFLFSHFFTDFLLFSRSIAYSVNIPIFL